MGGGGKGGSGDGALRFPPYMESTHKKLLKDNDGKDLMTAFRAAWDNNPYAGREAMNIEGGYLGSGYNISQFPSLFDMFGKFMAGLDIEMLWTQIHESTMNGSEADELISTFSQSSLERMEEESLPMLHAGMRNIGAVNSSAFVLGRALLESKRQKEITKFSAQVKISLLQITQERWARHLDWNGAVIGTFHEMQRSYYAGAMDMDQLNYKYKEAEATWTLDLFDPARAFLGALTGAPASANTESSQVSRSVGGALSGGAAGYMAGGSWQSTAIGAVLGLASSFM